MDFSELLKILQNLKKDYPYLKFVIGLVGVAIAVKIITLLLGANIKSIMVIVIAILGMYLLYIFSKSSHNDKSGKNAKVANFIMWIIAILIAILLSSVVLLSISAWTFGKPCSIVKLLDVPNTECIEKNLLLEENIKKYKIDIAGFVKEKGTSNGIKNAIIVFTNYPNIKPLKINKPNGSFSFLSKDNIEKKDISIKVKADGYKDLLPEYYNINDKYINLEMIKKGVQ